MIDFKIKPVDEMTLDELIGQVIMIGLPYSSLDDDYKKFISDYKIGNYILFARNYKDTCLKLIKYAIHHRRQTAAMEKDCILLEKLTLLLYKKLPCCRYYPILSITKNTKYH